MDLNTITEFARPRVRAELAWREGDAFLAGGTWLFSEPQPHLNRLIDLCALGWAPLTISAAGLEIAATCTLAQLAGIECPTAWRAAPLFGQCCRALLGSFKIWNAATVGGNLALALPAAPMAALCVALDGVCRIWSPDGGERVVPASAFILDACETVLSAGEVLRAIQLPAASLQRATAMRQISLTPAGRSAALLAGTRASSGGFALTVTGATRRPVHIDFDVFPEAAGLADALTAAIPDALYYDDLHGAPAWRRAMTFRLAEQIRGELA